MSTLLEQRFASRFGLQALSLFGLLASGACYNNPASTGAASNQSCPLGAVGCFCRGDGSCDGTLACVSDRCVDLNQTAGSVSSQSSSGSEGATLSDAENSTCPADKSKGSGSKDSEQEDADSTEPTGADPAEKDDASPEPDVSCNDNQKNGNESDVDCGGSDCAGCRVGQRCAQGSDCRSLNCQDGKCVKAVLTCESNADCDDKNPCTQDLCTAQKRCDNSAEPDGQRCNDADACTRGDQCQQGRCTGVDTRVFREDFSESPHAFLNGSSSEYRHWEIGPAVASSCAAKGFVNDPAQDHSRDEANGVMGVHIGGCQTTQQDNFKDCAWSDYIDVSGFESDVLFSYWRHLSSPGKDPVNRFTPLVTNSIYYRVPSGSPVLIESGWPKAVNDKAWTYIEHRVPSDGLEKVSFGICYKRLGSTGGYPGWTVDDVRVRQYGCELVELD